MPGGAWPLIIPSSWQGTAFNTSPDSDNEIHSDEMAQAYGFRGGLVPGVVVSACLIHPAVAAWGLDWLTRGHARVTVHKPTYHGEDFRVEVVEASVEGYRAELLGPDGMLNASGEFLLAGESSTLPALRGDPLLPSGYEPPEASLSVLQHLRDAGLYALDFHWGQDNEMASYLQDPAAMAPAHCPEGGGYANAAFLLGLTNWALAANVQMNPWIHLQTESRHYAPVARGSTLRVECDIEDLFSRRGHQFVDLNVNVFEGATGVPVMRACLRAIYRVRPVSG